MLVHRYENVNQKMKNRASDIVVIMLIYVNKSKCSTEYCQYSGNSLQRTCFIADTSLQRTLFLRMDEVMVRVSQKNLFIADRNSGHLSIADTTFGNQWQFWIVIDLFIADSHYQSKFITNWQCLCTNKNIIKTHLLNIKGQTDV